MSYPINVLLIEKKDRIISRVKKEFTNTDSKFVLNIVRESRNVNSENIADMADIVIINYQFVKSGDSILRPLLVNQAESVPCLVIAQKMTAQEIMEVIQSDAADYLLIQDLHRLVPTIFRALKDRKEPPHIAPQQGNDSRYQTLFESASDAILILEENSFIDCNDRALKIFGCSRGDIIGKSPADFSPELQPDGTPSLEKALQNIFSVGMHAPRIFLWKHRRKDGSLFDAEVSLNRVPVNGISLLMAFVRDITERREYEEALQKSEEQFRTLYENAPIGIYRTTPEGKILTVNPALLHMLGYKSFMELASRNLRSEGFEPQYPRSEFEASIQKDGEIRGFEAAWKRKDQTLIYVRENAKAIRDKNGNLLYYEGTVEDITEKKNQEMIIHRQAAALEAAANGIVITDATGKILWANAAFTNLTGYSIEESINKNPSFLKSGRQNQDYYQNMWTTIQDGRVWHGELINRRKNGSFYVEEMTITPVRDESGQISLFIAIKQDVTERKESEAALRESEERFRSLVENSPTGIMLVDKDGFVLQVNPRLAAIAGFSQEIIMKVNVLTNQWIVKTNLLKAIRNCLKNGEPGILDYVYTRIPEKTIYVRIHFTPIYSTNHNITGVLINVQDTTEQTLAEIALRKSEEEYRLLFENLQDMFYRADNQGNLLLASPSIEKLLGYTTDEVPHLNLERDIYLYPHERKQLISALAKAGEINDYEIPLKRKNNEVIWVSVNTHYYKDKEGNILGVEGIARDITRQKSDAERLQLTSQIISTINNIVLVADDDGNITYANPSLERTLGYKAEEILGDNWWRLTRINEREQIEEKRRVSRLARSNSTSINEVYERKIYDKNGEPHWILWQDTRGPGNTIIGTGVDITERKEAERAIRESERKYRDLFSFAPLGIYQSKPDGRLITANSTLALFLGYDSPEDLIQNNMEDLYFYPKDRQTFIQKYSELGHGGSDDVLWKRKDGSPVWIELSSHAIRDGSETINYYEGFVKDITERKSAEKSLQESEERYRKFFEEDLTGDFIATADGKTVACNPAFIKILGYRSIEEALENNLVLSYPNKKLRYELQKRLEKEKKLDAIEVELIRKNGEPVSIIANLIGSFDDDGKLTLVKGYLFDITDRKKLEQQLMQSQKMEAVGRLAGGIAHDFNNLLTVINGYSEVLLAKLPEADKLRSKIEMIKKAADRANALTAQLLAFSRRQIIQPRVININQLVNEMSVLLRRLIGEDIELVENLEPSLGQIKADPGQIEQVIMNLAVNGRDAMPNGGNLTIETRTVYLDKVYTQTHANANPGFYIMLSISDTGHGMDKETIKQIFEPFFTTKKKGKGTGLGLATVYGIVKQSGGYIWAYSEPGRGSTFKVYFPVAGNAIKTLPEPDPAEQSNQGSENILLAEDEEMVRSLAKEILEARGYTVFDARDGEEAIQIFELHNDKIDLLVTDVIMPQMSGKVLTETLTRKAPELKVLFMSGYTDNAIVHHGILDEGISFIQKPFTASGLAKKVREVLDKS